jgi:hypothetical protein
MAAGNPQYRMGFEYRLGNNGLSVMEIVAGAGGFMDRAMHFFYS